MVGGCGIGGQSVAHRRKREREKEKENTAKLFSFLPQHLANMWTLTTLGRREATVFMRELLVALSARALRAARTP
jgi:hypothetical protein